MKKYVLAALLLGLTVGSTYASAVPVCAVTQSEIPADDLAKVLEKAASFFGISEMEAYDAYQRGELSITQIKPKVYRVEMGGTWVGLGIEPEL